MAETQGFEPWVGFHLRRFSKPLPSATQPRLRIYDWCAREDLNLRPPRYQHDALPLSYRRVVYIRKNGSTTWARTKDILINSQTLYQLS